MPSPTSLPGGFLSLLPETSPACVSPATTSPAASVDSLVPSSSTTEQTSKKRSPSADSRASSGSAHRFLRLGHVQSGEERDFADVIEE
ncbi:hypothetical protein ANO11243_096540 [Dothideomycetidae sp. 11243]|nr:hypothetical protein ANO11243_096540 [fungal sp. No.11243]